MSDVYKSGERPMLGDTVRMELDNEHEIPPGTVVVVSGLGYGGEKSWVKFEQPRLHTNSVCGWRPHRFSLIARAGEPVAYQPGDVVECVAVRVTDGGLTVGSRYAVTGSEGLPKFCDDGGNNRYITPNASNVRASVRLVHRPDPVKAVGPSPEDYHDADSLAAATSPKTIADVAADLRPTINPGDTVTVRGVANHRLRRMIERGGVELLSHEPKPEPEPLKAGDVVVWREGVILPRPTIEAVEDGQAVVRLPLSIFDRL